jgi:hypothetical protein
LKNKRGTGYDGVMTKNCTIDTLLWSSSVGAVVNTWWCESRWTRASILSLYLVTFRRGRPKPTYSHLGGWLVVPLEWPKADISLIYIPVFNGEEKFSWCVPIIFVGVKHYCDKSVEATLWGNCVAPALCRRLVQVRWGVWTDMQYW